MIRNKSSFDLFEAVFSDFIENNVSVNTKVPVHDIIENDKEYIIELLLAGVNKDDTSIDVEEDFLIIKAERKEQKDVKYNRKETYFGKYERKFKLPNDVDTENITATMDNGVLKVNVPKLENIPAKISVKIN